MRAEAALRTHADALQRLVARLARALGHKLRSAQQSLLHLLLVLQLRVLGGYDAHHHVLVLGQVLERLEAACSLRVVLEIEGVDLQRPEELLGDDVVRALGEESTADLLDWSECPGWPCFTWRYDGMRAY